MDTHKFINFAFVIISFFIIFEVIFLFIVKRYLSKINRYRYFKYFIFLSIFFILAAIYLYVVEYNSVLPKYFDKAIYIMTLTWFLPKLILIPSFAIKSLIRKLFIKRKVLSDTKPSKITLFFIILPYLIVLYSSIFTTYNLEIEQKVIKIENLPRELNNLKIVLISDLHIGNVYDKSYFTEVIDLVNKQNADLIFITGDFVTFEYSEINSILPILKKLKAKYGIFSCNGNHEHYDKAKELRKFKTVLQNIGIVHLINENVIIKIKNYSLQIAGIDDINFRKSFGDISKTLMGLDSSKFTILLAHNPDIWDDLIVGKTFVNLTLSGHTHGGQYGIRIGNITYTPIRLLHKRIYGLFRHSSQYLYVTDGLGNSGAPMRFGITPKISVLILEGK